MCVEGVLTHLLQSLPILFFNIGSLTIKISDLARMVDQQDFDILFYLPAARIVA